MTKSSELKELSVEELTQHLVKARGELFELRNKAAGAKLDKPHRIADVRRTIARILTFIRRRSSES